ncbi:MAG TPA: mandelate racemase/muconate lactonizing enzyme family protein [Candidatus Eisenbacteria bacterium]|nr:mandelate racemase/muconate lactonizing enzyme family protein [Candidatus Eisenbacteria bacterium]
MQLEELEVIPYSLPFRDPYVTARGELRERNLILVRLRGEGLEGLGETAALSLRGGARIDAIAAEIRERCWPALLDGRLDPDRIWSAIARCRNRGASAQAVAAVDIALHDLVGRATGQPVWRLLGASEAQPTACNATLPAANPAATRTMAEDWHAQGFRTFKLKVGLAGDVTQVATVRQTLGPQVAIRVDANGAWSVDDATERLRAMARHTIELAEQPVGTFEQMVEVRRRVDVRLAADESLVSPFDARRARELGACELAAVKVAKVGGLGAALEIAEVIPSYLSSALEGPVGIAAAVHAVQALRARGGDAGVAHGLATERLFSTTVGRGATVERDRLLVGDRPGLGVEIDEEALAARRRD